MMTKSDTRTCAGNTLGSHPFMLYNQLKTLEPSAIRFLHHKTKNHLLIKCRMTRATPEDAEELTNDAVMLALQKILDGTYRYQGYSPLTFTLVIADNLLRNFQRKKRHHHFPIENLEIPQAPEALAYLTLKELEQGIENMLAKVSPLGQRVIRLKYYEGLRDEEVVEQQLTPYKTVDSLKAKRCAYMRVLRNWMKGSKDNGSVILSSFPGRPNRRG